MKGPRERFEHGRMIRAYRGGMLMIFALAALVLVIMITGCARRHAGGELTDIEFTVLDSEDAPEELKEMIREREETPFQITYADQGKLYIAEGYGKKPTTGYSVVVSGLGETEDAVHIRTTLLGPEKDEEIKDIATFPCVVVQLEYIDKDVLFD